MVLQCRCKRKFRVPGHLAGKKGKCPHCGFRFLIPGRQDRTEQSRSSSAHREVVSASGEKPEKFGSLGNGKKTGERACPRCQATYPEFVPICAKCSINLVTGKAIRPPRPQAPSNDGFWLGLLPAFTYLARPIGFVVFLITVFILSLVSYFPMVGGIFAAILYYAICFEQVKVAASGELSRKGFAFPDVSNLGGWVLSYLKVLAASFVLVIPLILYYSYLNRVDANIFSLMDGMSLIKIIMPLLPYAAYLPMAFLIMALFDSPLGALNLSLVARTLVRTPIRYAVTVALFWTVFFGGIFISALLRSLTPTFGLFAGPVIQLGTACMASAILGVFYFHNRVRLGIFS